MDEFEQEKLKQELTKHFLPAAREVVLQAMDAAYRNVGAMWNPESGCDMQWFGFTVWKFAVHEIRKAIEADASVGISVLGSGVGAFRLSVGPLVISPYSCGYRAPVDAWASFPNNDKGAGLLSDINSGQTEFVPLLPVLPADLTALVLAHYGNYEDGLEALFVKCPIESSNGRITRWGYIEELWRVGSAQRTTPVQAVLPGPAKIERPGVLPFKKSIPKPDTEHA